jgi:hypothetical protein
MPIINRTTFAHTAAYDADRGCYPGHVEVTCKGTTRRVKADWYALDPDQAMIAYGFVMTGHMGLAVDASIRSLRSKAAPWAPDLEHAIRRGRWPGEYPATAAHLKGDY